MVNVQRAFEECRAYVQRRSVSPARSDVQAVVDAYEALDTAARCHLTWVDDAAVFWPTEQDLEDTLRANDGIDEAEADDEYVEVGTLVCQRSETMPGRLLSLEQYDGNQCPDCQPVFVKREGT